jgi:rare lipoprotein A (peptidoglycan hydrolase)
MFKQQIKNIESYFIIASVLLWSILYTYQYVTKTESEILRNSYAVPVVCPVKEDKNITIGEGSWYDYDLNNIKWSVDHDTAASRTLTRYSKAKVTNPANGKSVVVYINDYGPKEYTGIEIDLSSHAFAQLAPLSKGLIKGLIIEQL